MRRAAAARPRGRRSAPASSARPVSPARARIELGEAAGAARVERAGLGIFVEQALELGGRTMRRRGDQRRRQMADRHRADAPLGLRRLAGIVDDERIDHRQRAREPRAARRLGDSATALPGSHSSVPCVPTMDHRVDAARSRAARDRTRHRHGAAAGRRRDNRRRAIPRGRDPAASATRLAPSRQISEMKRAVAQRRVVRRVAPARLELRDKIAPASRRDRSRYRASVRRAARGGQAQARRSSGGASQRKTLARASRAAISATDGKVSSPTA